MNSILTSIKKLLGIPEEYEQFDQDIIIHINSVLSILNQMGVGPKDGFSITDKTTAWSDFIDDGSKWALIESYVHAKVRLMFDPPQTSVVMEAIKQQISEYEWRLSILAGSN